MQATRVLRSTLLCMALAATAPAVFAQFAPSYGTYGAPMSNFGITSHALSQAALGRAARAGGAVDDRPMNTFPADAKPVMPRKLAASYPEARRAEAEKTFLRTLEGYHEIESKFGLRRNGIGGAVAAFIAGNHSAYRDEPFPDKFFQPLAMQMHQRIHDSDALKASTEAQRQEMYEQLAIIGTYMALTREGLAKNGDPKLKADMKRAARQYLEAFLQIDPDRMQIGPKGLVVK
jgi:hypothetical protein